MYPVAELTYPWIAGAGFLCGLPAVLIRLQDGAPKFSAEAIVRKVMVAGKPHPPPRWVVINGHWKRADNELFVRLRHVAQVQACIETDGLSSMCDASARLPMWDHVAVTVSLPATELRCELFHSVVVRTPTLTEEADLLAFAEYLGKRGYNGPKYLIGAGAKSAAVVLGRDWRITKPVEQDKIAGLF